MSNPYDPQDPAGSGEPRENPFGAPPPPPASYGSYGQQPADQPYGQTPYGQNPYGQNPYGGAPYGGYTPGAPAPKMDPVSITGFVLSFLCCLGWVGAILGAIGLSRTKGGQRRGRWAAISALVIGILMTAATVGVGFLIADVAGNVVTPDNAEAGQCVDVDEDDDNRVSMLKKECTEEHDAQIVSADDAGTDAAAVETGNVAEVCLTRLGESPLVQRIVSGELEVNAVLEDPDDVASGDVLVCYVENANGSKLDSKLE